jgi:hypothetical protein
MVKVLSLLLSSSWFGPSTSGGSCLMYSDNWREILRWSGRDKQKRPIGGIFPRPRALETSKMGVEVPRQIISEVNSASTDSRLLWQVQLQEIVIYETNGTKANIVRARHTTYGSTLQNVRHKIQSLSPVLQPCPVVDVSSTRHCRK